MISNCRVCHVCRKDLENTSYKVVSLRGVNKSSDTAVNGVAICANCLENWTPDAFEGSEKLNGIKAKITVDFKKLSDNARAELIVSHFVNENGTDWMNGTGSIKRTCNKLSKLHYTHECFINSVLVEIELANGSRYFNVYKPNELKGARFAKLDSPTNRERNGFLPVA